MLFPRGGIPTIEFDAVFTITPTHKWDHHSDTVFGSVEMLVHNTGSDKLTFPFMVLSTDPGTGAAAAESVKPKVYNGSTDAEVTDEADDIDIEVEAAEAAQRVLNAGGTQDDAEGAREYVRKALESAKRRFVGRTHIEPGAQRRIVAQQRLRVEPGDDGVFQFETIAPSPLLVTTTGGRVSVVVLMPFEDEDTRVEIVKDGRTELGFDYKDDVVIRTRKVASWFWRNDPVLRLAYRYV